MLKIIQSLLYYTIKMSTPLLLCSIGGVFVQKTGTLNFALEAAINTGAFTAILFTVLSGNLLVGCLAAVLSCMLLNVLFGHFVVNLKADAVIVGLSLNMLMMAIPPYILQVFFKNRGLLMATDIIDVGKMALDIPFLRNIPFFGEVLNGQTLLTYLAYPIIIVLTIVFYKTKFGIYVQVTGERRDAAEAVGIRTKKIVWISLMISAVTCALAGINLSVEQAGAYSLNMSAARGLICLAAINCGRRKPVQSCLFAIIFGFSRALQLVLANFMGPDEALVMDVVPYLTIILVFLITEIPSARKNVMRIFREE